MTPSGTKTWATTTVGINTPALWKLTALTLCAIPAIISMMPAVKTTPRGLKNGNATALIPAGIITAKDNQQDDKSETLPG